MKKSGLKKGENINFFKWNTLIFNSLFATITMLQILYKYLILINGLGCQPCIIIHLAAFWLYRPIRILALAAS